jgi:hypothetical protein
MSSFDWYLDRVVSFRATRHARRRPRHRTCHDGPPLRSALWISLRVADIFSLYVCWALGCSARLWGSIFRATLPQPSRSARSAAAATRHASFGAVGQPGLSHGTLTVEGERSQATRDGALDASGSRDLTHWTDLEWEKCPITRDQHPVEGATYRRLRAVILHVVGPERGTSRGEPNAEYLRVRQGLTDELASL